MSKVIPFEKAPAFFREMKKKGRKIVQCHGTFDLVHPGHLVHFEEARKLGDVLVVTITADTHVNKGPGRPFFTDGLRVKFLAALECVDFVVVVPHPTAVEAIACVRPDVYAKGREYEDHGTDVTGNIRHEVRAVRGVRGKVCYVGSVVFSSTKILNNHFDVHSPEVKRFCRRLSSGFGPDDFREVVEGFRDLRVLVVGDVIFDRYSSVTVQGLTSKNRILSTRFVDEETQPGGALAVFRHVRQFAPSVKIVSLVGAEPWAAKALARYVRPGEDEVLRAPGFTSIVKQRFVEPLTAGKELSKLFSVNIIDNQPPLKNVEDAIRKRIGACLKGVDLVLATDFGHGLFGDSVREFIQKEAPFLALNCQTNSNNHGFNIIDKRYSRADAFSLDQAELLLSCGRRFVDFPKELKDLRRRLRAKYAWLTRGVVETVGVRQGGEESHAPAFEPSVVDTVGAGDAFYAVAALAAAKDLPLDVATFLGQLAGAQAVRIIGNRESIQKEKFLKGGAALLNFT